MLCHSKERRKRAVGEVVCLMLSDAWRGLPYHERDNPVASA